jgi:SAM-dependent methyltransferase
MHAPVELPTKKPLSELYQDIWTNTAYRKFSPGERTLTLMLETLKPHIGDSFIDFGCGTGRPAKELQKRGYGVLGIDFASNSLDADAEIPFLISDLTNLPPLSAKFGYCTDVMEHIEPQRVDEVLAGIARSVRDAVFFSIATVPDNFGPALAGKQLHLTIEDAEWWLETLIRHWSIVEIVDGTEVGVFIVCRHDAPVPAGFYQYHDDLVKTAPNTPIDGMLDNVRINAARDGIPWICEHPAHKRVALLIGGGPSLKDDIETIRRQQAAGAEIVALNGAGRHLVRHGIVPDRLIVIDPRERNVEFVTTLAAERYLLASQCHPAVFDALFGDGADVEMFHLNLPGLVEALPKGRFVTPINGVVSAGLVAMSVLATMGYRTLHLYGYDSSDADGEAHAYPQELSAAEAKRMKTFFNGREYTSSYAMFQQAKEFEELACMLSGFGVTIIVHGSGLLPDIAKEMATNKGE